MLDDREHSSIFACLSTCPAGVGQISRTDLAWQEHTVAYRIVSHVIDDRTSERNSAVCIRYGTQGKASGCCMYDRMSFLHWCLV
jgi:hypothetical protein